MYGAPMPRSGTQAQPHTLDGLLLVVLLQGPENGFRLKARLKSYFPGFQASQGAFYPSLRRLESLKFISGKTVPAPADRGGLPRRVYAITSKGRTAAKRLLGLYRAFIGDGEREVA